MRPLMRRWRWVFVAVVLTLVGLALAMRGRRAGERVATSDDEAIPRLGPVAARIAPGLSILGGLGTAAYVVETSAGLILIDAGLDADASTLKREMAALGLDWTRVRAILLTHVHGDHSGGAAHLRAATGARVHAGAGDGAILRAGGPREAFFSTFFMPDSTAHATEVDVELTGGETIEVGDVRLVALATPGHTPGSVCYQMERGGRRVLFSGDVIMSLRGDRSSRSRIWGEPLGTYAAYLAPRYRGDALAYLATLRALRARPTPDLLLPGHPRQDPTPESPVVTEARWAELLDRGIRAMEVLLARRARDGAGFLDGLAKPLRPGLDYLGDFQGVAVYGLFRAEGLVVVNAPGGPGLVDFLIERVQRLGRPPTAPTAVLLTSGDPETTAGARALVERWGVRVAAPEACLAALKASCPPGTIFVRPEDLVPSLATIPLAGRGNAPSAHALTWGEASVVLSATIPSGLDQASITRLMSDLAKERGNVVAYVTALETLRGRSPNLWLPASPSDGQNANLYDDDWTDLLDANRAAVVSNPDLPR